MLGYIEQSKPNGTTWEGTLWLSTTAGGKGESLLEWQGFGEKFVFSNDGRFFTLGLGQPDADISKSEYLLASSDGSYARHVRGCCSLLTFSPDSSRVAYVGVGSSPEVGVMDLATGATRILVKAKHTVVNPVWVDNNTIVFTEYHSDSDSINRVGGIVWRVDVDSGETAALTPSDRSFSTYNAPVTFSSSKIALNEKDELNNLWSLDVDTSQLRQITNNTLFQFRAGYLPGTNMILFEVQSNPDNKASSEIGIVADDGSSFRLLTEDFYFDGVHSYSVESNRVIYQKVYADNSSSIWTINPDGSESSKIAESKGWVGDPNFVPVKTWQSTNPLQLEVVSTNDKSMTLKISNPSSNPVDATLRAFPGNDLLLKPVDEDDASGLRDTAETGPGHASFTWNLALAPGETRQVDLETTSRPAAVAIPDSSLLMTLSVDGTPPRMYWQDFG